MLKPIETFQDRFGPIRYLMAPMAGITDLVFRSLMREMGAQAVVSELISSEGIVRGSKKTYELMRFEEDERPVGIQIFGGQTASLVAAARKVQELGADFVDVNFGCPVKKVVCDGSGAAWLRTPKEMYKLLSEMKSALRIPLTIKVRTGWDATCINVGEVVQAAYDAGVSWVAIHGRTRAQGYSGNADWELIREVSIKSPLPIIGNGDILSAAQAIEKLENGYANAVMIGRGALKNPWIFQEALNQEIGERNFLALVEKHIDLALKKKGDRGAYLSLKKFLSWYASGFPGCSAFRQELFATKDLETLSRIAKDYFQSTLGISQETDNSPFLMGGHG